MHDKHYQLVHTAHLIEQVWSVLVYGRKNGRLAARLTVQIPTVSKFFRHGATKVYNWSKRQVIVYN